MEIEKLSIAGQIIVPKLNIKNRSDGYIRTEETLKFALLHSGFNIQGIQFKSEKRVSPENMNEFYDVRIDLYSNDERPLTLMKVAKFFDSYNICFIGNFFTESKI